MTLILLLGCSESPGVTETDPRRGRQDDSREALRGLGYADVGEEEDLEAADGLLFHDPEHAWRGYTLYTVIPAGEAHLIDMQGHVLRSWVLEDASEWSRAVLLPDGDLLAIGASVTRAEEILPGGFLQRMSFDGEVEWRLPIGAHHDVEALPDGRILVLGESLREAGGCEKGCGIVENSILLLDAEGQVLDRCSAYDALTSDPGRLSFRSRHQPSRCAKGFPTDCLHLNTVRSSARPDLEDRHPIFAPGNVLVTSRAQDSLAVIHLAERRLVWSWGAGELQAPHEGQVLPNGRLLIFDNGLTKRGWSRIVELDPVTESITWEYKASPPESFYTPGRGTVQPLPNGNVLVVSSGQGAMFEVTREGDEVWRFQADHFETKGKRKRRYVVRGYRYPAEWVEPLLEAGR